MSNRLLTIHQFCDEHGIDRPGSHYARSEYEKYRIEFTQDKSPEEVKPNVIFYNTTDDHDQKQVEATVNKLTKKKPKNVKISKKKA